jgi:hypothetical protein
MIADPSVSVPAPATPITVWVTDRALDPDGGIAEMQVDDPGNDKEWLVVRRYRPARGIRLAGEDTLIFRPCDWHRTKDAAIARAKRMRATRIRETGKELAMLRTLTFDRIEIETSEEAAHD